MRKGSLGKEAEALSSLVLPLKVKSAELQFFASLAGSLAWPATVVVVVLRNQCRRFLLTLTRLRYKDLELDFGRELKEVEKKARRRST